MITRTALAQKFKEATAAFAKARPAGLAANAAPYHKDAMVDVMWPLLAEAWEDGRFEGSAYGIGPEHNPYGRG